jgi:serine/threonine protein kinase
MSGGPGNWTLINDAADEFDRVWKAGQRPRIEDFLADAMEHLRPGLLSELLEVERELRGAAGEALTEQECRARFPEYAEVIDTVFRTPPAPAGPGPDADGSAPDDVLLRKFEKAYRERRLSNDWSTYLPAEGPRRRDRLPRFCEAAMKAAWEGRWPETASPGPGPRHVAYYLLKFPELGEMGDTPGRLHALEQRYAAVRSRAASDGERDQGLRDFEIIREIGHGGAGTVYEARQVSLGRVVALKTLKQPKMGHVREEFERFTREARIVAGLGQAGPGHANIIQIYSAGLDVGMPYYTMPLMGGSLADVIEDRRNETPAWDGNGARPDRHDAEGIVSPDHSAAPNQHQEGLGASPPSEERSERRSTRSDWTNEQGYLHVVARLLRQAAEGMEYARTRGIIHRDLKPGNLLIDGDGTVRVADFGLARSDSDPGGTATGDVFGTPSYMSPEQAVGSKEVDHRSDVYSLGATLYEAITLRCPFEGGTPLGVLDRVKNEAPPPPRAIKRAIPRDLETIVLKAMERVPAERYQTAGELAADLGRFLDGVPIWARRAGLLDRAAKWARRHPGGLATGVLSSGMVAVTATLAAVFYAKESKRGDLAERKANGYAYKSLISEGKSALDAGDASRGVLAFVKAVAFDGSDARKSSVNAVRIATALDLCQAPRQIFPHPGKVGGDQRKLKNGQWCLELQ